MQRQKMCFWRLKKSKFLQDLLFCHYAKRTNGKQWTLSIYQNKSDRLKYQTLQPGFYILMQITFYFRFYNLSVLILSNRHGGHDIDIAFVMEELRFVVTQPLMDANSALILNAGVHLLKSISFHVYQKLVKGLIQVLLENYRGRVIWKTTTSIGDQQSLYYGCARRFHTEQVREKTSWPSFSSQSHRGSFRGLW